MISAMDKDKDTFPGEFADTFEDNFQINVDVYLWYISFYW